MQRRIFALSVLALAVNQAVYAADEPAKLPDVNVTATSAPQTEGYAEGVSSTGTKTDAPAMETPVSVQVVSHQVIEDQKAESLDQAVNNVSGVNAWTGLGMQENYTIRGFYTTTTLRDGFKLSEYSTTGGSTIGSVNMADVESVEVLKGPAAILYGKVEPGGIVNVIRKQPLDHDYGSVEQLFGSYGHSKTSLDLTGPVNEDKTVLYRFNASYDQANSWVENSYNRNKFIAPIIEWRVSPQTTLTLEGEYGHNEFVWPLSAVPIDPTTNKLVTSLPNNVNLGGNDPSIYDTSLTDFKYKHEFNDDWSIKQEFIHQRTVGSPVSNYYPYGFDPATGNSGMYQVNGVWYDVRTLYWGGSTAETNATILDVTGNFDTAGIKHKLLFGGDFYHSQFDFIGGGNLNVVDITPVANPTNPYIPVDPTTIPLFSSNFGLMTNWGLYVQDQAKLPGNVNLLVGLRDQFYKTEGPPDATDHHLTPRIGAVWQAQHWLSLYGSYTENFGNNNGWNWQGNPLPPEDARQKEVGAKTEFYDGKLISSLAVYDITKFNIAIPDYAHPNGQGGFFNQTGGEIKSHGVEFDIQGQIQPGWDAIASFTYSSAIDQNSIPNSGIIAGNYQADAPVHMANFWSSYKFLQESLLGWKVGGGAKWKDKTYDVSNQYTEPDSVVWDAMASYEFKLSNKKSTLQFNFKNIFDKVYFNGIYPVPSNNYAQVTYGDRRSESVSLKVEF